MPAPSAQLPLDLVIPPLLADVLAVSLTAINLLSPLYEAGGSEVVDFALEYLNPAAQRITGLAERPGGTMRARFPDTLANGVFALYQRVFESGEAGRLDFNYQADGFDNYFHVAARRSGELLVVSFTDTADHDRTPVELALRASQAAEREARAQTETQRRHFYEVLLALPAQVATYHGPDHVYDFVNPRYQQYFPQVLLGRSIREVIPGVGEQGIFTIMDRVYQTGEPFDGRELDVWIDFGGSGQRKQIFLNLFFYPLRDAQGRINGLLDFSYDVTEQVRARRQLEALNQGLETRVAEGTAQVVAGARRQQRQREAFTQIFADTPAAICIQRGPAHRYEYVNAAYQHFFPGRQLLGRPVAEALPETVEAGIVALLDGVYRTGEPYFGYEVPLLVSQPDGQPPRQQYFTFTYQAYRENGEIVGISTFAYDVAEQVRARQQREAQQAQLRVVFEQAPVAIFVLHGPTYRMTIINPAMQQLLGQPLDELLGKPYLEALPELAEQGYAKLLHQVWHTGQPYVAQEQPARLRHHAETRYFTFTSQPLRDAQGHVTDIMCVAIDVTDQVLARQQVQGLNQELAATNEELHALNAQLRRTNVDLDTFVYTASHDLKAPITNIEGIALALRDTLPAEVRQDELVAQLLGLLDTTVARFQYTIAQLTDISRLQLAHVGPAEPVGLAAVVEDVRLDLVPAIGAAGTQLTVEVAPELVLSFSPANLRSIVYNLLSNAVKYRDPARPSQVQVRAQLTGPAVVLTVQDNGLGMSELQQRQLFGLFQRLHTHVEGTGVGLYISKRLVENAGGTITVQSQPAVGTTFTVTFPA